MADIRVHDADIRVHDADIRVHDARSQRSRWTDLSVHDPPIPVFTMGRYPHLSEALTNRSPFTSYPQSKNARCFISGLSGAWSSTRSGGALQPYAQIYVGPAGDLRMRVSPSDLGMPVDRVGANASCIQIK